MGKMLDGRPLTETMMSGAALMSTVTQTQSLGNIGQEVLESFGINTVELEKKYSYRIRGAIHEAVRSRFGEEALFYFGYTQLDGYASVFKALGYPIEKYIKKNTTQINSKNVKEAACARDGVMTEVGKLISTLNEKSIFCPKGPLIAQYFPISELEGEYSLTNAVLPEHESFNRGAVVRILTNYLANNWCWKVNRCDEKMESGEGWATFVWQIEFLFNKKKRSFFKTEVEARHSARENFIKKVLEDADSQKKNAEKQKVEAEKQKEISQQLASQLGRYIPPQIHKALLDGNYNTDVTTRRKKLTVFFSDIKNFTSTSEALQPEDLTNYLNEYFSEMTTIALKQGATIDKYIGDAVMLFFGDPETKGEREDARACVEMALQMQEKMVELREKWRNQGFADPFQIRIGLNTGYCNVGNFGSDQRLTYTIIGGEVNVAARLESAATANGILMSYETYAHAQDMVDVEEQDAIKMKGINREIKIFSIKGRKELKASLNNDGQKKLQKKDIIEHENLETKDNNQFSEAIKSLQVEIRNLAKEVNALKKNRQ